MKRRISDISIATGIPAEEFRKALGIASFIVVCKANTVEEAEGVYNASAEGSEAERIAFEKWIDLCSTVEEAKDAYYESPEGSEAQHATLEKWIDLCSTVEEAEGVYYASAKGSKARHAALLKMYEMY